MVENFIVRYNEKYGKSINKVPKKTMALFKKYNWPANSRELENVIERAVILSNTSILKAENLIKLQPKKVENFQKLEDFEREYIIKVLNSTFWQVSGNKGAAVILGLHPETLRSKMRKLNINKPKYI
jgi:transcriptional regulator with GAF, ATPase, and Fis domain